MKQNRRHWLALFSKKKKKHAFIEQDKPSEKFVIAEGRTKSFWYRWHWKLRGFT